MLIKQGRIGGKLVCLIAAVSLTAGMVLVDVLRVQDQGEAWAGLPAPDQLIDVSKPSLPAVLAGMRIDPERPLAPEFLVDLGDAADVSDEEAASLIQYFLAALTVPESELWVNLSPYETDRVLAAGLESTGLGRDLLAQDYLLKQLASSLTHPDTETGRLYWEQSGVETLHATSLQKVWIMPDLAAVKEEGTSVVITDATLKVMTEADYAAMQKNVDTGRDVARYVSTDDAMSSMLPAITKDVNEGVNFVRLRQIYHSLILAKWFKQKLADSLYAEYIDTHKLKGIDTSDPALKEKIFGLYVESFKKGVYDEIRNVETLRATSLPQAKQRFFSGGIIGEMTLTSGSSLTAPRERLRWVSSSMLLERLGRFGGPSLRLAMLLSVAAPVVDAFRAVPLLSSLSRVHAEVPANATTEKLAEIAFDTTATWSSADRVTAAIKLWSGVSEDTTYQAQAIYTMENESDSLVRREMPSLIMRMCSVKGLEAMQRRMVDPVLEPDEIVRSRCALFSSGMAYIFTIHGRYFDRKPLIDAQLKAAETDPARRVRLSALMGLSDYVHNGETWVVDRVKAIQVVATDELVSTQCQNTLDIIAARPAPISELDFANTSTLDLMPVLEDTASAYTFELRDEVADTLGNRKDALPVVDQILSVGERGQDAPFVRVSCVEASGRIFKRADESEFTAEYEARYRKLASDNDRAVRLAAIKVLEENGRVRETFDTLDAQLKTEKEQIPYDTVVVQALEDAIKSISLRLPVEVREKASFAVKKPVKNVQAGTISGQVIILTHPFTRNGIMDFFDINGRLVGSVNVSAGQQRVNVPRNLSRAVRLFQLRLPDSSASHSFKGSVGFDPSDPTIAASSITQPVMFYSEPDTEAFDAIHGGIDLMSIDVHTQAASSVLKQIKLPADFAGFSVKVTGRRAVEESELSFAR